ncbi:hypothetical protein ACFLR1_05320 [Bacteroidota bacterium]
MKKGFAITLVCCFFLSSCYKKDVDLPEIGLEYFPIDLGKFVEYKVDSVWQDDPIGQIGSGEVHYLLRDVNESSFTDEEGRQAIRVERSRKQKGEVFWNIKDVWHRVRTSFFAEQNEENVIFVKLRFPVKNEKAWDGNARNTWKSLQEIYKQNTVPQEWPYTCQNVHEPYTINGFTFDSTVTVLQIDRSAVFGLNVFAKEVYAKNVGLIHKEIRMYDVQTNPSSTTDTDSVGFSFEMVVTDFGS